jgi:hypothetical protein
VAVAVALLLGDALALALALAEVFTLLALTLGEADALGTLPAWAGTRSAVAGFGAVDGAWSPMAIAAATPPGPPTTVPASAATVIAGYLRIHDDWLTSERVIGLCRPCLDLL